MKDSSLSLYVIPPRPPTPPRSHFHSFHYLGLTHSSQCQPALYVGFNAAVKRPWNRFDMFLCETGHWGHGTWGRIGWVSPELDGNSMYWCPVKDRSRKVFDPTEKGYNFDIMIMILWIGICKYNCTLCFIYFATLLAVKYLDTGRFC